MTDPQPHTITISGIRFRYHLKGGYWSNKRSTWKITRHDMHGWYAYDRRTKELLTTAGQSLSELCTHLALRMEHQKASTQPNANH